MTTLLLAHADPSVAHAYRAAMPGVTVIPFTSPFSGMSSAYDALVRELRRPLIAGLYQWLLDTGHRELEAASGPIVLAWWSGGFALARAMALDPVSRAAIAGWVGLDGGHTGLDPDGTANDAGVAWAATLASEAREGRTLFWYGYTDVEPGSYASSRKFIEEVQRLGATPGGQFRVHAFGGRTAQAHIDVLRRWGPGFCADALEAGELRRTAAPVEEICRSCDGEHVPITGDTLAERAVRRSFAERARFAGESPRGSGGGPDVAAYFAGCVRDLDGDGDDEPLGLASGEWCAAAACWAAFTERRAGDQPIPHGYRAAGIELERDAKARGAWRSADVVRSGGASIARGDLAIWQRGPAGGWQRHVARVAEVLLDGAFTTIGGNEDNAWGLTDHRLDEAALLGFVAYPR